MKPIYLALTFIFLFNTPSFACDLLITKTELPLEQKTQHENLCLENFFHGRDLGRFSLGEDHRTAKPVIFRDTVNLTFNEIFLFKTSNTSLLGIAGRIALAKKVYAAYLNSLRNDHGACKMEIRSEDRLLSVDDFIAIERDEAGQPGSRIMLTKDDIKSPNWKLLCPDVNGNLQVEKQGSYFFLFADVYDNTSIDLVDNLGKYLFSFRK